MVLYGGTLSESIDAVEKKRNSLYGVMKEKIFYTYKSTKNGKCIKFDKGEKQVLR
jgi:hypothetical protein